MIKTYCSVQKLGNAGIPRNRAPLEAEKTMMISEAIGVQYFQTNTSLTGFPYKKTSKLTLQVVHIAIVIGFTPHFDGLSPQLLGFL